MTSPARLTTTNFSYTDYTVSVCAQSNNRVGPTVISALARLYPINDLTTEPVDRPRGASRRNGAYTFDVIVSISVLRSARRYVTRAVSAVCFRWYSTSQQIIVEEYQPSAYHPASACLTGSSESEHAPWDRCSPTGNCYWLSDTPPTPRICYEVGGDIV